MSKPLGLSKKIHSYHALTCQKTPRKINRRKLQYNSLSSPHVVSACFSPSTGALIYTYLRKKGTLTSFWHVNYSLFTKCFFFTISLFTIYDFTSYDCPNSTYCLASLGVVLVCRRTLFWHVDLDNLVWHVRKHI